MCIKIFDLTTLGVITVFTSLPWDVERDMAHVSQGVGRRYPCTLGLLAGPCGRAPSSCSGRQAQPGSYHRSLLGWPYWRGAHPKWNPGRSLSGSAQSCVYPQSAGLREKNETVSHRGNKQVTTTQHNIHPLCRMEKTKQDHWCLLRRSLSFLL